MGEVFTTRLVRGCSACGGHTHTISYYSGADRHKVTRRLCADCAMVWRQQDNPYLGEWCPVRRCVFYLIRNMEPSAFDDIEL